MSHLKRKTLSNCYSFFIFLIRSVVFRQTGKNSLSKFCQLFLQTCVAKIRSPLLDRVTSYCVYVLKFRICNHGMLSAPEINSNWESMRRHVESCSSTTNIISPLQLITYHVTYIIVTYDLSYLQLYTSYLHNHNVYDHQTWQSRGDLWWEAAPTHKIPWTFGHVVLRDHWTN